MSINSLYSLTWGDYGTSLVSAVQLLRCHGDLVDCTLAAGGRSFPAHKIVLCAASPFLLDLLKNTPCKHPVVMLAGVNANDLEALLEFVYRGEVSVDHSQLPSLLQAAHCLNIQGLAPQTVTTHKDEYTTSIQLHPTLIPQHHVKAVIDVGNNTVSEELITIQTAPNTIQAQIVEAPEEIQQEQAELKDISHYLPQRKRKPRARKNQNGAKMVKTEEGAEDVQQQIQQTATENQIVIKQEKNPDVPIKIKSKSISEQPAACPICNSVLRQSRNLKRHLELKHFSRVNGKKRVKTDVTNVVVTSAASEETPSTSQTATVAVTMGNSQIDQNNIQDHEQQPTHVVTQQENTDGTTSLSIAQVMPGHQITLGSLNQATIIREDQLESGIIATHEPTLRPHTELFRTVYTIEERRPDQQNRLT